MKKIINKIFRSAAVSTVFCRFVICLLFVGYVQAEELDIIDADTMSGNPARILASIEDYKSLGNSDDVEVLWRLLRAYYNYYDEQTERDRSKQKWAAEQGWEVANAHWNHFAENAEFVYFKAVIGIAYLEVHRITGPSLPKKLRPALEQARRLDPTVDDGGPDRRLGLSYLLPWPFKDRAKALSHMHEAVRHDDQRAANRLGLAKALAEDKQFDEGWTHIQAVRTGTLKQSSDHWRELYKERVEKVAAEFPQFEQ